MAARSRFRQRTSGFTLIEMIVTIVIIGILGVGISSFIGNTTKGMVDTAERSQVATIAWLVSERLSRSLRHALPNSIRISGDSRCLEYIPIYAGSDYLSVPVTVSANQFEVAPFSNIATGFNFTTQAMRVAVYPNTDAGLYSLSATSMISSEVSQLSAGATANAQTLTLSASHQFPRHSPNKRLFLVTEPNMYCFQNGLLVHYRDYGYNATFSNSSSDLDNEVVMGSRLGQGLDQGGFNYLPNTLQRNGVVTIEFNVVGNDNLVQRVNQEVQIRNVP
jgi:MSHA biogenesis protein MshO